MNTSAPFSRLAFATSVASFLGSSWSASPYFRGEIQHVTDPAKLTRSDGLTLVVGHEFKGRVEVALFRPRNASGSYPSLWDGCNRVGDPLVAVGITRTPEAVAKDLARRLIPDAERVHALALAAVAKSNEYAEACKRAETARDAANKTLSGTQVYASAAGREVEFRAHVAPEQAEAFARLVADFVRSSDSFNPSNV